MPRPRTDEFWERRIGEYVARANLSAAAIQRLLKKEKGPTPPPSDRAIRRIMAEFKQKPEEEQEKFRLFRWPDAMESGALPWEASRACLDFLAYMHDHFDRQGVEYLVSIDDGEMTVSNKLASSRPSIDFMQSYWNVTQAAPDASLALRLLLTASLFVGLRFQLEGCLAYSPWTSETHAAAYSAAIAQYHVPPFIEPEHVHYYDDARMLYLCHIFRATDTTDHIKEIRDAWAWLSALCKKVKPEEVKPEVEQEKQNGRSSSRKTKR